VHIPDVLDLTTCVSTGVLSAGAVAYAIRRVRREFADRTAPLMGVMAACLFAAQMMNFPIPGATSGHLLGGVLAAVVLGPWGGLLVLAVVLLVQSVLFQDGGITALGANVLNLGVIGSLVGYSVFAPLRQWVSGPAGTMFGAVVAAWFSVVLAAAAAAVELAVGGVGGSFPLGPTLGVMLLAHAMIGVGEALITGLAVGFLLETRPDLVYGQARRSNMLVQSAQVVIGGLAIALVAAVFLSPFKSPLPDGLERTFERLGFDAAAAPSRMPDVLNDYQLPGLENVLLAGSAAGALGTLIVFAIAFFLTRALRREKSAAAHTPDAS
jgi:cobalt/nickel transport system permease protein